MGNAMVGAAGVVTGVVGGTAAVNVVGALGTVGEVNVLALGLFFPPFSARAAAAATASVCKVVGDLLRSCFFVGVPTFISGDRSSRDCFRLSRGVVEVLIVKDISGIVLVTVVGLTGKNFLTFCPLRPQ